MKLITISALLLMIASCNLEIKDDSIPTSKTEALTMLADDSTEVTDDRSEEKTTSKEVILKARGSEPGWYAEFYTDRVKLLLNYGKDSLTWKADFSDLTTKKNFKATMKENNNGKTSELTILLKEESCTESASGDQKNISIVLIYNNQSYSGCAGK